MALTGKDLARKIADALDEEDVSEQLEGWADAVVEEVISGTASFGGVPGPHGITGLVGPRLAKNIADNAEYPNVTKELLAYATAITIYVMAFGKVTYDAPPPPSGGGPDWFIDGTISGMVGKGLAQAIATAVGYHIVTKELLKKSTAVVDYIQANAGVLNGAIS